jgi:hypothetical protein
MTAPKNKSVSPETVLSNGGYTSRPVPDPTVLTTQQMDRGLGTLRELIETRLDAMDKAIITALEASREATRSHQIANDKLPELVGRGIGALKDLHEEKFDSIQVQFKERDLRAEQTSKDSKIAVDAALQAAKEAVGEQNKSNALAISKSEAAFTKQADQMAVLVAATTKALDDKIDDIKARVSAIEGRSKGIGEGWAMVIGGVGVVFGLVTSALAVFYAITRAS